MVLREPWPRWHTWTLVAIVILAIGTAVALTLISSDLRDHERLDSDVQRALRTECVYAKANRQIVVQVLTDLSRGSFLDAASQQRLRDEAALVQARVDELDCDGVPRSSGR